MVHGIFHGDLHGGNLMVLPDGRIGLLDHAITAHGTPLERNAFLRLMISGAAGNISAQLEAFRDLGASPLTPISARSWLTSGWTRPRSI